MSIKTSDTVLEQLFTNAEAIMGELGNTFIDQEFLRKVIIDQQAAYIDLLAHYRSHDEPVIAAHKAITTHLAMIAEQFGYLPSNQGRTASDIFGNPTKRVLYRALFC